MRPSKKTKNRRRKKNKRWKKAGVFCSWLLAIYAPEIARPPPSAGNETSRGKRVEKRENGGRGEADDGA
jgi:hypothetical protein